MLVLLGALAAFVVPFLVAYGIDRARGVEPEWTPIADVQTLLGDKGSDDAPAWAEALGTVLAMGLFVRSGCHIYSAFLARADPHVADNDVTVANTVLALRDDWQKDLGGRIFSLFAGVEAWLMFKPLGMQLSAPPAAQVLIKAFVVLNIAVLLADPLLLVLYRLKLRYTTTMSTVTHDDRRTGTPATDGGRTGGGR